MSSFARLAATSTRINRSARVENIFSRATSSSSDSKTANQKIAEAIENLRKEGKKSDQAIQDKIREMTTEIRNSGMPQDRVKPVKRQV
ncbi:hypothetical protein PROFUN_00262 [Planoprotostelium fungivorum]|uniref:Uncharacterized protein n=1 Tax=Planoprotostelium fungivorum TaxID=1890364 RepID=A0A2P6NXV8_9EUKA|nr:hypothetical protein PROFUN_00262 [Planoprotostelium fungivorum]